MFENSFEGSIPLLAITPNIAVRFTVWGEPASKERPRVNRKTGNVYTPTATKKAEAHIAEVYRSLSDSRLFETPVTVECVFYCYKQSKRDIDNMFKLVLDALNGIAYADDYVVGDILARRVMVEHSSQARTSVTIKTNHLDHFERLTDESWQTISRTSQRSAPEGV
jgi:Holliday junction resolvase RusA-like endonuclease